MWTSLTNQYSTDNYKQVDRFLTPEQSLTHESLQTLSPHEFSLHSCQNTSTLSPSSEHRFQSSEEADSRPRTSPFITSSHRWHRKSFPEGISIVADKNSRRKQQNRNAQRAFRSRKEAQQKYLEDQLDDLKQKHAKLIDSFTTQCQMVSQLKTTITDLNAHVGLMQAGMFHTLSPMDLASHEAGLFAVDDTVLESSYH